MQAVMSLSLLWVFSLGSTTSGYGRRTCTVNSRIPLAATAAAGCLCSGTITIVAGPTVIRGSWYGVRFTPRVTMRRTWTPSVIPLARSVS